MGWWKKEKPLRDRFLAYYEELLKLLLYIDKEADIFNEEMKKYKDLFDKNLLYTDSQAAKTLRNACKRGLDANRKCIAYLDSIASIMPEDEEISSVHSLWAKVLSDSEKYAEELSSCIEASVNRKEFDTKLLKNLKSRENNSSDKAAEGISMLLEKRFKVSDKEHLKLYTNARLPIDFQGWKPGYDVKDIVPTIGREISWADIVNQVFRVLEFDRSDTTIEQNNQVKARSSYTPYGYLLVESPILNQKVRLPIIHRDDFLLAASVFDEPVLADLVVDEELLVTYAPEHLRPKGLSGSLYHVLHYVITPRGTLDSYYSMNNGMHMAKPNPQKLFGPFVYQGEIKVPINSELEL